MNNILKAATVAVITVSTVQAQSRAPKKTITIDVDYDDENAPKAGAICFVFSECWEKVQKMNKEEYSVFRSKQESICEDQGPRAEYFYRGNAAVDCVEDKKKAKYELKKQTKKTKEDRRKMDKACPRVKKCKKDSKKYKDCKKKFKKQKKKCEKATKKSRS